MDFVRVAETSEIPVGSRKAVTIQGKEILIANVDGAYYAIQNRCPHAGQDLSRGSLEGKIITCPRHGAKFDVTTGKVVFRPKYALGLYTLPVADAASYEAKADGNSILVKV